MPPILELAKELDCGKKQIIAGYRDRQTFLREEFEKNGELFVSTEDGSVGVKGNVLDAVREHGLEADIIYACGPTPMLRAIKAVRGRKGHYVLHFPGREDGLRHRRLSRLRVQDQRRRTPTPMYIISGSAKTGRSSLSTEVEI